MGSHENFAVDLVPQENDVLNLETVCYASENLQRDDEISVGNQHTLSGEPQNSRPKISHALQRLPVEIELRIIELLQADVFDFEVLDRMVEAKLFVTTLKTYEVSLSRHFMRFLPTQALNQILTSSPPRQLVSLDTYPGVNELHFREVQVNDLFSDAALCATYGHFRVFAGQPTCRKCQNAAFRTTCERGIKLLFELADQMGHPGEDWDGRTAQELWVAQKNDKDISAILAVAWIASRSIQFDKLYAEYDSETTVEEICSSRLVGTVQSLALPPQDQVHEIHSYEVASEREELSADHVSTTQLEGETKALHSQDDGDSESENLPQIQILCHPTRQPVSPPNNPTELTPTGSDHPGQPMDIVRRKLRAPITPGDILERQCVFREKMLVYGPYFLWAATHGKSEEKEWVRSCLEVGLQELDDFENMVGGETHRRGSLQCYMLNKFCELQNTPLRFGWDQVFDVVL